MEQQNSQQLTQAPKHTKLKMAVLVMSIILLLVFGVIAKSTFDYYTDLSTNSLNLHSFETGGKTEAKNLQTVGTIRNSAAENFADDPSIGPSDAKLTIVMFEDFQCPFCRQQFAALRTAIAKYSDRVRFVYRDFPISELHANAQKAAEAANCANEQQQFWSYHDKLFLNADNLTVNDLKLYAAQLHLDTAKFDNCLDTGKYTAEVAADFQDGVQAGVTGTPTFFFNGNRLAGVLSEEGFKQLIAYFTD